VGDDNWWRRRTAAPSVIAMGQVLTAAEAEKRCRVANWWMRLLYGADVG
jgi:hypothetical protein